MNKKSFWRGFGVGVLFASVILGVSCLIRTSDARVISQAKKLGMVFVNENTTVVEKNKKDNNTASAAPTEETNRKKQETKSTDIPAETENPKVVPTPEPDDTSDQTSQKKDKKSTNSMEEEKNKMEKNIKNEAKQLEIKAGDWSSTVSAKLQQMGIIKDATDFDLYLSQNGYGESIAAGTYTVSPNDSYQDLAKKITGK